MTEWEIHLEAVQPVLPFLQGDDLDVAKATSITNAGTVLYSLQRACAHVILVGCRTDFPGNYQDSHFTDFINERSRKLPRASDAENDRFRVLPWQWVEAHVPAVPSPSGRGLRNKPACLGYIHGFDRFKYLPSSLGFSWDPKTIGTPSIQVSGSQPVGQDPFAKPLFPKIFTLQS